MRDDARVGRQTFDRITPAELDVLTKMSNGMTMREIAESRASGYQSVNVHAMNLREKLQANTTEHAVAVALRRGIIA